MVVDARAAARRIVEQVLADHAQRSGTPVTTRPEVPDTPAWRAARRIVDEVLAAHGGGLVPTAEGALASVTGVVDGPPGVLVQREQATPEVVAETVQRIVQREATADPTRAPGSPEPTSAVTTEPPVDLRPAPVSPDPEPEPDADPVADAEPEPEPELEVTPEPDPEPAFAPEPDPEPAIPTFGGDVDAPADVARRIVAEVLAAHAPELAPQDTVPPPVRPQPPVEPQPPLEPPPPPVEPRPIPPVEPRREPSEPEPEPTEPTRTPAQTDPEPTELDPEPVGVSFGPVAGRVPVAEEAPDHAVVPAPSRRTGRWLLATLFAAIALAWLFPLAVGALRDLVALSS